MQSLQLLHWLHTQFTDNSVVVEVVVDLVVVVETGHLWVLQLFLSLLAPKHLWPAPCCLTSSVRVLSVFPTLHDLLHWLQAPHWLHTQSVDSSVVVVVGTGQLWLLQLRRSVLPPRHLLPAPCCSTSSLRSLTFSPLLQERLQLLQDPHLLHLQSTDNSVVVVVVILGHLCWLQRLLSLLPPGQGLPAPILVTASLLVL